MGKHKKSKKNTKKKQNQSRNSSKNLGVNTVEFLNDKEMMTFAYLIYETAESNSEDSKKLHDLEQLIAENAGTEEGVKKFYMHIFNRFMQTNHYQVTSDLYYGLSGQSTGVSDFYLLLGIMAHLYDKCHEEEAKNPQTTAQLTLVVEVLANYFDPIINSIMENIRQLRNEHLDDGVEQCNAGQIKARLSIALAKKQASMALKLIGSLLVKKNELDEGESYYLEGISHYINHEYSEACYYLDKVVLGNCDFNSAFSLKLECCALMGERDKLQAYIHDNLSIVYDRWLLTYMFMTLAFETDNPAVELPEEIKMHDHYSPSFKSRAIRLAARALTEGFELKENALLIRSVSEDSSIFEEDTKKLKRLNNVLSLFVLEDDSAPFKDCLSSDSLNADSFDRVKTENTDKIYEMLLNQNPEDFDMENFRAVASIALRLKGSDAFIDLITGHLAELKKELTDGNSSTDAMEFLRMAYVESTVQGNTIPELAELVKDTSDEISDDINTKQIIRKLSPMGKLAFQSAEKMLHMAEKIDFTMYDAGMLGLGYYRIIELEINQRIIFPMIKDFWIEAMTGKKNSMDDEAWKTFVKSWKFYNNKFEAIAQSNYTGKSLMLGEIYKFFLLIRTKCEENDSFAVEAVTFMKEKLFTEKGVNKYNEGFFEEITGEIKRNRYRNPPAHTKYLSFKIAEECRDVVKETLLTLNDMLVSYPD